MTTSQQIENFTTFAKALALQEGEDIALDEIFNRWWEAQHQDEDRAAIQKAINSYQEVSKDKRPMHFSRSDAPRESAIARLTRTRELPSQLSSARPS